MATKTISITEEAYRRLANLRERERESFSEVIIKVTGKNNLMNYFGILSKESAVKLENNIEKIRKLRESTNKQRIDKLKIMFE